MSEHLLEIAKALSRIRDRKVDVLINAMSFRLLC